MTSIEAVGPTAAGPGPGAPDGDRAAPDPSGWTCPAPLRGHERIVMGHGGGGALSAELVEQVFAPAFGGPALSSLADSAALEIGGARLAFSTDSFVVRPLFFPPAAASATWPSTARSTIWR